MQKFIIPPSKNGYSVSDGIETLSVALDGGSSRYRKDILKSSSTVECQWIFDRDQYNYFRVFYKNVTVSGSLSFYIDLYIDNPFELTEHKAYFVPGSVKLTGQSGNSFTVSATLEVMPTAITQANNDAAMLYGLFGNEYVPYEDLINRLTNVYLWNDFDYVPKFVSGTFRRTDWQGTSALYATSRTNLLRYSEQINNNLWLKQVSGTASAPVVTANYGIAPDGTTTADRVVFALNGATDSSYSMIASPSVNYSADAQTLSIWLKTVDGSTKSLNLIGVTATGAGFAAISVTGTWQRFSLTESPATSSSTSVRLRLRGSEGTSDSADLLVWGWKYELGSTATSYIPTTSAAVTVTDYSIDTYSNITLALVANAIPRNIFAYGNNSTVAFPITTPNGSTATVSNVWRTDWQGGSRTNSATYSEPLLSQIPTKSATVTQGSITDNGLSNGVTFPAAAQDDYAYKSVTVVAGQKIAASFFVKMTDGGAPVVGVSSLTGDFVVIVGGSIRTSGLSTTSLGAGLYQVRYFINSFGTVTSGGFGIVRYAAQSGRGFTVTGYHIEINPIANAVSSYIKTETSPVTKYDVSATKLYATSRTNYAKYSNQFDNAAWTKSTGVSVTPNTATAPDGTTTADTIVYDGSGSAGGYRIFSTAYAPYDIPAVGTVLTLSIWLRSDIPTIIRIFGNSGSYKTCNLTSTWQRFAVTATYSGVSNCQMLIYSNSSDNSAFNINAVGAQIEPGSVATYYIPTTSSAVTLTDYSAANNVITFAQTPAQDAILEWDGTYQGGLNGTLNWTGTYNKNNVDIAVTNKTIATETGVPNRFQIVGIGNE